MKHPRLIKPIAIGDIDKLHPARHHIATTQHTVTVGILCIFRV